MSSTTNIPSNGVERTSNRGAESWYAFRVYGGRSEVVARDADRCGYESYIPMQIVERNVFGRVVKCQKPLVSSLLFLRADLAYVNQVRLDPLNGASVYCLPGSGEPSPIPDSEMVLFRRLADIGADNIEIIEERLAPKSGLMRVVDGPLKGCVGYMARVRGAKRLVVSIEGITAVATSYIPKRFLESAE